MARFGVMSVDDTKLVLAVAKRLRSLGYSSETTRQNIAPGEQYFVRNDSGEEVPAFGCMQVTGTVEVGGQNYFTIEKPVDASGLAGGYLFNSYAPIEIDGYGLAFAGPIVRALTDSSTVTCGQRWQPEAAAWNLIPGGSLIVAAGDDDIETDILRGFVAQQAGGEAYGTITGTPSECASSVSLGSVIGIDSAWAGGTITATNPLGFAVKAGMKCVVRKSYTGDWVIVSVPAAKAVVDVFVDAVGLKQTKFGCFESSGTESTVDTWGECP